ncbi:type II secretion system protein [Lichenibacterium ramalinae]|uniref:Prepilin-type N-terminal cleavage/methylation domain-containing protein n=1 Tax=Lichenibacterium ramalinae TaxID=2316527 RepID=A0A4Q2R9F6_9HYPH|nr:prepilin-type N-terminal cleavage/methylation domain-containing protein [Lichenibacterium ramalinae]RYB02777.1 prepilin-type N-terminal cleavage/methylation domain-containing protein [Lichenibacterium ramalinae]
MSTSSPAAERRARRRRGFTLVEALVALVVAGLLLPTLARALAGAWSAARMPLDVVSGITLARDVAAGGALPPDARQLGYAADRSTTSVTLLELPSDVAPAPGGTGQDEAANDLKPDATPSAIRIAAPKGFAGASPEAAPADVVLRRVSVSVRTPAGRRLKLDALRIDDASR